MPVALIALGANLGNARATIERTLERLARDDDWTLEARSRLYDTSPVLSSGPDYVNAVARVHTNLSPQALLERLLALENECGRIRPPGVVNAPRTLDLDLLAYDNVTLHSPELTLPHPRARERLFVLVPLADIEGPDTLWEGETLAQRIEAVRRNDPSQRIAVITP